MIKNRHIKDLQEAYHSRVITWARQEAGIDFFSFDNCCSNKVIWSTN